MNAVKGLEVRMPNIGELFIVNNQSQHSFIRVETNYINIINTYSTWGKCDYDPTRHYSDNWSNRNYFIYGRELATGILYRFCSIGHGNYNKKEFKVFGNGYPKIAQEIQLALGGVVKDIAILLLTGQTFVGKQFGTDGEWTASNGVTLISEEKTSPHFCNVDRIYVMGVNQIAGTIALPAKNLQRVVDAIKEFNENFS